MKKVKYELTDDEFKEAMKNKAEESKVLIAGVVFKSYYTDKSFNDTVFDYSIPKDMDLHVGDYVVAETRYGLTLGLIKSIVDSSSEDCDFVSSDSKIICKVPYENYYVKKKKLERANEIKKSLTSLMKKADEYSKYEMIRAVFPEAGPLIDELKGLMN